MTLNKREKIEEAFARGSELMEWGDYLEALDRFLHVYEIDKNHEENLENLTYCYYCAGNESQLVKFATCLTDLKSGNSHGEYYMGKYYHDKGRNHEALQHLLKALEISAGDSETLTLVGRCYMYLNDFNKSLEYHNRAIENDTDNAIAYYNRAKLRNEESRFKEVVADLELAVRHGKHKPRFRKFLVYAYTMVGECNKAIEIATKLLSDYPADLATLVNRAVAYACNDNMQAFEQDNQRCIDVASENIRNNRVLVKSYFWRAFAFANLREMEKAKRDISTLSQLDANQARIVNERIQRQLDNDFLVS